MGIKVELNVGGDDFSFYGWYVDVFVFLMGESCNYQVKKGSFGCVKVNNFVNEGGFGVWQLGI